MNGVARFKSRPARMPHLGLPILRLAPGPAARATPGTGKTELELAPAPTALTGTAGTRLDGHAPISDQSPGATHPPATSHLRAGSPIDSHASERRDRSAWLLGEPVRGFFESHARAPFLLGPTGAWEATKPGTPRTPQGTDVRPFMRDPMSALSCETRCLPFHARPDVCSSIRPTWSGGHRGPGASGDPGHPRPGIRPTRARSIWRTSNPGLGSLGPPRADLGRLGRSAMDWRAGRAGCAGRGGARGDAVAARVAWGAGSELIG
jgi:hypothetical protein